MVEEKQAKRGRTADSAMPRHEEDVTGDRRPCCPLCGPAPWTTAHEGMLRYGHRYDLLRCNTCGTGMTSPLPGPDVLDLLYAPSHYRAGGRRFTGWAEALVRHSRRARLARIERQVAPGRILDLGCGRGLFLSLARESGWEVSGTEYDERTARHARDVLGIDVRCGGPSEAGFETGSFDAVTAWHVLEHLSDPRAVLEECRRLLRPGGLLAVALPNLDSIQASLSGGHWFHLDLPRHLYHFPARTLLEILADTGFAVTGVKHLCLEQNLFGFLQSFLNRTGLPHNCLYDMLKHPDLGSRPGLGPRVATLGLLPLLFPVALFMTLAESGVRRGGTVQVFATRR